ncbi:DUF5417 domain-containing protein [Photorhabdus tasmaniensis]
MKLSRQTTTDTSEIEGTRCYAWGRKHYFIIENAPMADLMAIDELLDAAGWESDHCPTYEEDDPFGHAGYSCGYWIEIDDVEKFKSDYKRLKSQINAHIINTEAARTHCLIPSREQTVSINRGTITAATFIEGEE